MNSLILGAQFIPVLGFLFILLFGQSEDAVARISLLFTHLLGLVVFALLAVWVVNPDCTPPTFVRRRFFTKHYPRLTIVQTAAKTSSRVLTII